MKKKDFGLAAQIALDRPEDIVPVVSELSSHSENFKNLECEKLPEPEKPKRRERIPERRPVGRPPKKEEVVHTSLSLSREMHSFLRRAWRRYETKTGEMVDGPSAFVEELLRAYRGTVNP